MKRYPYNLFASLVLLSVAGAAFSQSQSEESVRDTTKTGTLSGRVVNESGQPIANAAVTVRSYGVGRSAGNTSTDNDGNFQVGGLEPAAYLVSAYAPTYVQAPRDPDINPIGYYRVGESLRIELIKGGVITGAISRSPDEPVVRVTVRATMVRDSKGKPLPYGSGAFQQTTDDRGVYRIYGLPPGTYVVSAGGGSGFGYVDPYDNDTPTYAPSGTRDGATEVLVSAGVETANVDIRYRGEPGHAVSGIAKSAITVEQPTGFTIRLSRDFNGVSQSEYSFQPPNGRGFAFNGVADGEYDLVVQSYIPNSGVVLSEPRRIRVRGADVTGIELTAKPMGSMSGTIGLEESKAPECQGKRRLVFNETVVEPWHNEKLAPKDQPEFVWGLGGPTVPDKAGNFTLNNLAPGQYRFNTRPMSRYWYLKSIAWPAPTVPAAKGQQGNRPADSARNWTTLGPGERMSGLIITMAEGAASLSGQIDLGEGQKLTSRLFAYIVPAEREKANDILRYFVSMVSADGSFMLNNLPPGRYWLIAQPATENESNIFSKLRLPDEIDMRAKLLRDAEAAKIETEIKPCQNVTTFRLPLSRL